MKIEPGGLLGVGIGIFFVIFSLFWMSMASAIGAPGVFVAFGIPFVLIGAAIVVISLRATVEKEPDGRKYRPMTYEDYLRKQQAAAEKEEKEKEDPDTSRLSTDDRH